VPDCALIAPAAAFHSSTGACLDAFMLVDTQVERLFRSHAAMRMETRLRLLSQDAQPVTMADGRSLAVEGGLETSLSFDLVHIASFRVGGPAALAERIAASGAFLAWLRNQHERGAIISASGSAVFLLAEAGLLGALPVPMPRALIGLWRTRYPRLPTGGGSRIDRDGQRPGRGSGVDGPTDRADHFAGNGALARFGDRRRPRGA
jgi:hypothetical protein